MDIELFLGAFSTFSITSKDMQTVSFSTLHDAARPKVNQLEFDNVNKGSYMPSIFCKMKGSASRCKLDALLPVFLQRLQDHDFWLGVRLLLVKVSGDLSQKPAKPESGIPKRHCVMPLWYEALSHIHFGGSVSTSIMSLTTACTLVEWLPRCFWPSEWGVAQWVEQPLVIDCSLCTFSRTIRVQSLTSPPLVMSKSKCLSGEIGAGRKGQPCIQFHMCQETHQFSPLH